MLTQQQLQQLIDYDPKTGLFYRAGSNTVIGSTKYSGYVRISVGGKYYRAHRLAWLWYHGTFPTDPIDHINGIVTDNRIENLRMLTVQQNNTNKLGRGYYRVGDRYRAQIRVGGKKISLGTHDTVEAAKLAYLQAKLLYHPLSMGKI